MNIAILHVGDLNKLALGGVDQYIKNIIRQKGNNEITVYGTVEKDKFEIGKKYTVNKNGLIYNFVPVSYDVFRPLTIGYVLRIKKYENELEKYDIIYAQRIELCLPFWNSNNIRKKLVQVIHGSSFYTTLHWGKIKSQIYFCLEKISIRIAKKTNVVLQRKEFGVPYYKTKYKELSDKIGYAKIPVNTDVFKQMHKDACRRELNIPLDKNVIMYGGRVENYPKRVLLFPQIIKGLIERGSNVFFLVIGNGSDLQELTNILKENLDSQYYRIVGYLEDRNLLVKYLNASDININISEFEGTCTSSLEAVSCGCKILSTDVGDISLFVSEGKDGCIIENNSRTIVENSIKNIEFMIKNDMEPTKLYENYSCNKVVHELFSEFYEIR